MKEKAHLVLMPLLVIVVFGLGGCGTSLDVEAPPDVDVRRASIKDDGTYHYVVMPYRSGTLKVSLSWEVVSTPRNNPMVRSGRAVRSGTTSFEAKVEAGGEWERAGQYRMAKGDVTWGTLELKWID